MRNVPENTTREGLFLKEMSPHFDALYSFAYYVVKDTDQAKDLVQETLLKAYRYYNYYEQGTNAKSWLFKILQNTYINEYRKANRAPSRVHFEDTDIDYEHFTAYSYEMLQDMMSDEIMEALNSISPELRAMIILKDVQGFKYEEISRIFDIPMGTTKNRLFRARNQLKRELVKMGYNRHLN